jgi:hypothetical protein
MPNAMKTISFLSSFFLFASAFSTAYAQTPDYKWAVNPIGTGDDRGFKITADNNGKVIVTGRFHSKEILFGNIKLINSDRDSSTSDIFIA